MDTAVPGVEVKALLQASPSSGMDQDIHVPTHIQAVLLGCWSPCVFPAQYQVYRVAHGPACIISPGLSDIATHWP